MSTPSRPSRFAGLRLSTQPPEPVAMEPQDTQEPELAPRPTAVAPQSPEAAAVIQAPNAEAEDVTAPSPAKKPPKRGRGSQGKRSDPNYVQVTAYILNSVHLDAGDRLRIDNRPKDRADQRDLSDIIGALLEGWAAGRFEA